MSEAPQSAREAASVVRSPEYRKLLIMASVVGLAVSLASWCFLSLVPWIQEGVYRNIPEALGFDEAPMWWPVPVLAIAGLVTALAITRMTGGAGSAPSQGLSAGATPPNALASVLLAALASLGLGLVLGPSSPVIALGTAVALLLTQLTKGMPDQARQMIGMAGAFAALAMVFNSPIIAAIIIVEAAGLGGPMAAVIVIPGLLAGGIGSLVYLGLGYMTGLSTAAYSLQPLSLPPIGDLTVAAFGWTIVVAAAAAVLAVGANRIGIRTEKQVMVRPMLLIPAAGVVVAVLAIAFAEITGEQFEVILFSGSRALNTVVDDAAILSVATIVWLLLFKSLAWSISMGSFRGGPVFPAVFIGTVGGLLAAQLPGFPLGAAVPAVLAASVVAVLKLPLAASVVALLLTGSAGPEASPLIVVAVVVAYVVVNVLTGESSGDDADPASEASAPSNKS